MPVEFFEALKHTYGPMASSLCKSATEITGFLQPLVKKVFQRNGMAEADVN